jgi:hypothetical protein
VRKVTILPDGEHVTADDDEAQVRALAEAGPRYGPAASAVVAEAARLS